MKITIFHRLDSYVIHYDYTNFKVGSETFKNKISVRSCQYNNTNNKQVFCLSSTFQTVWEILHWPSYWELSSLPESASNLQMICMTW